ncbi:IS481 family transposase [Janibacter sp. G349]|uniref:IS481 family transposase n=1 Tax=unclassified Janibacter TaxID=2649294 RepID=UPI003B7B33B7
MTATALHHYRGLNCAHIAAEAGLSRQCLSKWVARYREHGVEGLHDRSSRPGFSPTATSQDVVDRIIELRTRKWSARRIHLALTQEGAPVAVCTIARILRREGLNRLRDLDVDGQPLWAQPAGKITACYPGHMIHLDVKKVGRIPAGGGWWAHGRGSQADRDRGLRGHNRGSKVGYTYIHSAVDGFTRLAYTESHDDETAATAIAFLARARVFFAAHGINRITRIVTDNGSCYRAGAFNRSVLSFASRHKRIKPYTPKHNGKVERYQQTMAREALYAAAYQSEEERRQQLQIWLTHYNYHRPHSATGDQPPASRAKNRVTKVMPSYT